MMRISFLPVGTSLAALGLAGVFLLNFQQSPPSPSGSRLLHSDTRPAQVTPITGTNLSRVTLTERAAQRLGITTDTVRPAPANNGATVIPYAAVLYDTNGATWAYTNPEALVYVRHQITVDSIDQDVAVLSDGPPVGTRVVTTGAAELFGAEFGIGK